MRYHLPPKAPEDEHKLTVVLDMDETLIHSKLLNPYAPRHENRTWRVFRRPGLKRCLEAMANEFELVVFTAGKQSYADPILDAIDPLGCIKYRLYRDSTIEYQCCPYVKDLGVLGRDMRRTVLLDNAIDSFRANPDNGIPIRSFYTDRNDGELFRALHLFRQLDSLTDIRPILRDAFGVGKRLHMLNDPGVAMPVLSAEFEDEEPLEEEDEMLSPHQSQRQQEPLDHLSLHHDDQPCDEQQPQEHQKLTIKKNKPQVDVLLPLSPNAPRETQYFTPKFRKSETKDSFDDDDLINSDPQPQRYITPRARVPNNNTVAFGDVPKAHEADEPSTPIRKGAEEVFDTPPVDLRQLSDLERTPNSLGRQPRKEQDIDPYLILGVDSSASMTQIEHNYRLAMERVLSMEGANSVMELASRRLVLLQEAYAKLSSSQSRLSYDRFQHCDMNEMTTQLFVGSDKAVRHPRTLLKHNIQHIISLVSGKEKTAEQLLADLHLGESAYNNYLFSTTAFVASENQPDQLLAVLPPAVARIKLALSRKEGVLVHTRQGANRAAAVVVAYLIQAQSLSLESILHYVRQRRANCLPCGQISHIESILKSFAETCQ